MAVLLFFVCALWSAISVSASPRSLLARGQQHGANTGGDTVPPDYSHDGSWDSKTDGWGSPSQYDGSWDHSSTLDHPSSQYGGGSGDGWGHTSTCVISTIQVAGPTSTVYLSGSDYTTTLPAPTVYISEPDHTSYAPASTHTVAGPAQTSVKTIYATLTQPAVPTTIYITHQGPGWNRTVTHERTEVSITTQHEVSTIYNEETTTTTSLITLPGRSERKSLAISNALLMTSLLRHYGYILRDPHCSG